MGDSFVYSDAEPTYRWYCYADDDLTDCMGRRPQMYDPISEWDDEHNACGLVVIFPTEPGQPIQEDWEERLGGAPTR